MHLKNNLIFAVREYTYIYLILLLLLIPLQWLSAWFFAIVIHELCHYISVRFLGGKVYEISVGIGGITMRSEPMAGWKSLIAILSGPLCGLVPVFLKELFPRLAICCWFLSLYNLLPLSFLDGGHALQIVMGKRQYIHFVEKFTLIILLLCAIYACFFWNLGVYPLIIVAVLWLRNGNRTCKAVLKKVQ